MMQKCKYLEDLGIPTNEYGTNFTTDEDPRKNIWLKERELYGFDNRETWSLDKIFIEWIYTRLMMYKEVSIIDTSYHKVPYRGKEITQEEAIDKILDYAKEILLTGTHDEDSDSISYKYAREICDLWKEILPLMWW